MKHKKCGPATAGHSISSVFSAMMGRTICETYGKETMVHGWSYLPHMGEVTPVQIAATPFKMSVVTLLNPFPLGFTEETEGLLKCCHHSITSAAMSYDQIHKATPFIS